jgi:uncharacterized protein (DUF1501 family)
MKLKMKKVQILRTCKVALDGIGIVTKLCLANTQEEIPVHLIAGLEKDKFVSKKLNKKGKKELDAEKVEADKVAQAEKAQAKADAEAKKEEEEAQAKKEAEEKEARDAEYSVDALLEQGREAIIVHLESMDEEFAKDATDEQLAEQLSALFLDDED